ncbi:MULTISPECIES: hypothetical protein [unclassified Pseudodesulfovibrio]|uniref:hypothetical protein n=1 Tax=unclassified Pseudodesulfovibrio TaxID=2661612 RepID=UPI000FEB8CA6|nr:MULTISPECIES: hypothetical protein [unclassified Pseudodesulfovibrio]MCJ2163486.1 hypothetical protein [Pseudodesulfovibrio sp. S3-i]RWU06721.1 hypothetical protein DWB63_02875 [Pseudodesulfovibrio sp. S3]
MLKKAFYLCLWLGVMSGTAHAQGLQTDVIATFGHSGMGYGQAGLLSLTLLIVGYMTMLLLEQRDLTERPCPVPQGRRAPVPCTCHTQRAVQDA